MTSVSNAAVGAFLAGNSAAKARHGMNEAIARLSSGVRSMYGGDAGGASVAHALRSEGRSALMAARIQDTDFARSSANLAKFSIMNQSAMAMVAQANQASSAVLSVLQ